MSETQGTNINEVQFSSAKAGQDQQTPINEKQIQDPHGFAQVPTLLKALEEKFPVTAAILSITGYVVIAGFGHMDSIRRYGGYILFLVFAFTIYKVLGAKAIIVKFNKFSWIYISVIILCLSVILAQNWNWSINHIFNPTLRFLTIK